MSAIYQFLFFAFYGSLAFIALFFGASRGCSRPCETVSGSEGLPLHARPVMADETTLRLGAEQPVYHRDGRSLQDHPEL